MPSTDQLKQTIESNNLVITTLKEKAEGMWKEVEVKQKALNDNTFEFLKGMAFIPVEILSRKCDLFITYDNIRLRWQDFERDGYYSDFNISIQDKNRWFSKEGSLPEYEFELSASSSRITIKHNPDKQVNLEKHYYNILTVSLTTLLLNNVGFRNQLIKTVEKCSDIPKEAQKINSAIDKLTRENGEIQKQIESNEIMLLIKPHGETSLKVNMNVDIPAFSKNGGRHRYGQARHKYYDWNAICITKQTKNNFYVDFVRTSNYKQEDGTERTSRWVEGTRRLKLEDIVRILQNNKQDHLNEIERERKREESAKKAVA